MRQNYNRTHRSGSDRQRESNGRHNSGSNYNQSNNSFFQKFRENYRKQLSGDKSNQLYQSAFPLKHIPEKLNFSYRLLGRNIFNKSSVSSGNYSDGSNSGGRSNNRNNRRSFHQSGSGGGGGGAGNGQGGNFRRNRRSEKRFKNYMRFQAQQGNLGQNQLNSQDSNTNSSLSNATSNKGNNIYDDELAKMNTNDSQPGSNFNRNHQASDSADSSKSDHLDDGPDVSNYRSNLKQPNVQKVSRQVSSTVMVKPPQIKISLRSTESNIVHDRPNPQTSLSANAYEHRSSRNEPMVRQTSSNLRSRSSTHSTTCSSRRSSSRSSSRSISRSSTRSTTPTVVLSNSSVSSRDSSNIRLSRSDRSNQPLRVPLAKCNNRIECTTITAPSTLHQLPRSAHPQPTHMFSQGNYMLTNRGDALHMCSLVRPVCLSADTLMLGQPYQIITPKGILTANPAAATQLATHPSQLKRQFTEVAPTYSQPNVGGSDLSRRTTGSFSALPAKRFLRRNDAFRRQSTAYRNNSRLNRNYEMNRLDNRRDHSDTASMRSSTDSDQGLRKSDRTLKRNRQNTKSGGSQGFLNSRQQSTEQLRRPSSNKAHKRGSGSLNKSQLQSDVSMSDGLEWNRKSSIANDNTIPSLDQTTLIKQDGFGGIQPSVNNQVTQIPNALSKDAPMGHDSDLDDPAFLDLNIPLFPIAHYVKDREQMLEQMLLCVKGRRLQTMLPDILKVRDFDEVKARCLDQLECMSKKRIISILQGKEMLSSSGTDESHDEENDKIETEHIIESKPDNVKPSNIHRITESPLSTQRWKAIDQVDDDLSQREQEVQHSIGDISSKANSTITREDSSTAPRATCVYADEDISDYYDSFKAIRNNSNNIDSLNALQEEIAPGGSGHYTCSECGNSFSSSPLPSPSSFDSECSACEVRQTLRINKKSSSYRRKRFKRDTSTDSASTSNLLTNMSKLKLYSVSSGSNRFDREIANNLSLPDWSSDEDILRNPNREVFEELVKTDEEHEVILEQAELEFLRDKSRNRASCEAIVVGDRSATDECMNEPKEVCQVYPQGSSIDRTVLSLNDLCMSDESSDSNERAVCLN